MAGLYSRVKTWVTKEVLTAADLNAEFDNIINNFIPSQIDDYSASVSEMQTQTDPGAQGSESQATTLAGEIARLRFAVDRIIGKTYWYDSPDIDLSQVNLNIDLPQNRIVSGRVRSDSDQPLHLQANGAAATISLLGNTTNFVYNIDGTQYSISSDVTKTLLTLAPSSNNTCLVNDANLALSRLAPYRAGFNLGSVTVDTMGSEIQSLVGSYAGFKWNTGGSDEYLTAYVKSTTELSDIRRSWMFNSSDTPSPAIQIVDNDTITLLKLTWVFANTAGALEVTYNKPIYSSEAPSSPSNNDYWFDTVNDTWKKYTSPSWAAANAILVGECMQDATNCIASRSYFPSKTSFSSINTLKLDSVTTTTVLGRQVGETEISVYGNTYKFKDLTLTWDTATDMETGISIGNTQQYFLYITEDGLFKLSDYYPYLSEIELKGWYHPLHSWRAVGGIVSKTSGTVLDNVNASSLTAFGSKVTRQAKQVPILSDWSAGTVEINKANQGELALVTDNGFTGASTTPGTAQSDSECSAISGGGPLIWKLQCKHMRIGAFSSGTIAGGEVHLYRDTAADFSSETKIAEWAVHHEDATSGTNIDLHVPANFEYTDYEVLPNTRYYYRIYLMTINANSTLDLAATLRITISEL